MFEGSLVESNHLLRTTNRWTAVVSITVQVAIAAGLVILPLLHPEALPFLPPKISLFAPTPPPVPPPVQPLRASAQAADQRVYQMPTQQPVIRTTSGLDDPAPAISLDLSKIGTGLGPEIALAGPGPGPYVIAERTPPPRATPTKLTVSSGVAQGLLLAPLHPVYPPIAIATRTEGTVVVHAVISKTGTIESAQIASGPALLQNAALQAVRDARYAPYKLNGQAIEVETTFSVIFRLGN